MDGDQTGGGAAGAPPAMTQKEERLWGLVCHLSGLAGHVFPFANVVGPLVVWILKRDASELVNDQGKEAVNFQISFSVYMLVCGLLCFVLIGFILFPIAYVTWLVLMVIASVKANEGVCYRYPLTFRLVK